MNSPVSDGQKGADKSSGAFLESVEDALNAVSVGFVTLSPAGKVLGLNAQACKDFHLDWKDDILSVSKLTDWLSVYHGNEDIVPGILERLERHKTYEDVPAWTCVRLHRSGTKFYIEGRFTGRYDENGQLREVVFMFRNIEEEISREFILDMAMSRTKIFPWFFDLDNNKMIIDARWFAHLGIPQGDCTLDSGDFFERVHPDDRDELANALKEQLSGNLIPDAFTYRLRCGDGTWEWFEEQSVYLGQTDKGSPYRIVGVCQSVQDYKQTEESLRTARDKARASDRLKSAFLANMSHEIRTPLNAIMGFSNLLTNDEIYLEEEEKKEYSRLITTNGEQLLVLISDILDLSKIESNTMEFHFGEASLNTLFTDIFQMHRLNMSPGVELMLDIPENDVRIETDVSRIRQIMNNLINNAEKFTLRGYVTLGYRISGDGTQAKLFVRDTGKGIPPEQLEHIFERFYKVDTFVKGAGLGLSICQTIAEHLGGTISVASKVGKGTCFTVIHPLRRRTGTDKTTGSRSF